MTQRPSLTHSVSSLKTGEPPSLSDYKKAIDAALTLLFGIGINETGFSDLYFSEAQAAGNTPEEMAYFIGAKYGLTTD